MSHSVSIIYSYYEKNDAYRTNMLYFLRHGYIKDPTIMYTIVVNGSHTIKFPSAENILVIQRENTGFDFQGYYIGLLSLKKRYDYYVFVNCSVRGPFLPPYTRAYFRWYQPLLDLLKGSTKLVGSTINYQPPSHAFDSHRYSPHVQSYCFAMDAECQDYLINNAPLFKRCYTSKSEVILHQEVGMSTQVLQKGWNISCLIPEYQDLNYRDASNRQIIPDDILWEKNALGRVVHPYEVIFSKIDRGISEAEIETLTNYHLSVNDRFIVPDPSVNIAICFHLGYGHMWSQFVKYIINVYDTGYHTDLYVTYQKESDPIHVIRRQFPNAIFIQTTRGCDTGAFLLQIEAMYHKKYDYVFKLHTKKREDWRLDLLDPVADTTSRIRLVCQQFKEHPEIGMIYGNTRWIRRHDQINEPLITELCQKYHTEINGNSRFVGGTIFWVRWAILKKWVEDSHINLRNEYNRCELGYLVNNKPTFMHSWERIFGYIVNKYNMTVVSSLTFKTPNETGRDNRRELGLVSKIKYGISFEESEDVTDRLDADHALKLWEMKIGHFCGDPFKGMAKRLYVKLNDGHICVFNENDSHMSPNNYIVSKTGLSLRQLDNYEARIGLKHHDLLGNYRVTYFDWPFYYKEHRTEIRTQSYNDCLIHYARRGYRQGFKTFNDGENLLKKYRIQLLADYHILRDTTSTIVKQDNSVAKSYGLDGFCFIYNWKIYDLDKIMGTYDFPMCFSTTPLSVPKNLEDMLETWINQFNHLLPFFKGSNYIKINNCPLIFVEFPTGIDPLISLWNKMAIDNKFKGIYFVNKTSPVSVQPSPSSTMQVQSHLTKSDLTNLCEHGKKTINYNALCSKLVKQKITTPVCFRELYLGFNNGILMTEEVTTNAFYASLCAQIENVLEQPNPTGINNIILIHAWNNRIDKMELENKSEFLDTIYNVNHQYTNPRLYNQLPNMILGGAELPYTPF